MIPQRLPDLDESGSLGGWLAGRAVSLSLAGIAAAAVLAGITLVRLEVDVTVEASGTLEPLRVWRVHSPVSGVLRQVRVRPGDRVKAGQVLARMADFEPRQRLERLRLELRHQRDRPDSSEAGLELLEQEIRHTEEQFRRLELSAPAAGVVLGEGLAALEGRHVGEGELLLEIGSAGAWKAELLVPEREIDTIRLGDAAKIEIRGQSLPATVTFVGTDTFSGTDPARGSMPGRRFYRVLAALDGEPGGPEQPALRRGMSVRGRVITRTARAADLLAGSLRRRLGGDG